MITQKRLKELLHYNPETGDFTRTISRGGVMAGSIAGAFDTHGYIQIRIDRKLHLAHRLVFLYINGEFPESQVDHVNHQRADNRIENLRQVLRQDNLQNQSLYINNSSGVSGVSWSKGLRKWKADIQICRKRIHLVYYPNINDAIIVRKMAESEYGFHANHGA